MKKGPGKGQDQDLHTHRLSEDCSAGYHDGCDEVRCGHNEYLPGRRCVERCPCRCHEPLTRQEVTLLRRLLSGLMMED